MSELRETVESLPLGPGVEVIHFDDAGLVALNKPPVILSHPNTTEDIVRSLLNASYDHDAECYSWDRGGAKQRAWLVNRLDSPTSGIVLVAVDGDLAATVKELFATRKVKKVYHAVVKGTPSPPSRTWSDTLTKTVRKGKIRVKVGMKVPAKTDYQVVRSVTGGLPVSVLRLEPLTGRTHQLRVQCSRHKHPVVGDATYGDFKLNKTVRAETGVSRMLLHSSEISLRYPFRGHVRAFDASAPLPEAFEKVTDYRLGLHKEMLRAQSGSYFSDGRPVPSGSSGKRSR